MKDSLQRQLSASIAGALLGVGLLAASLSFWLAFSEAQERQDDSLRQIALLTDIPHLSRAGERTMDAADLDPDARIVVQYLTSRQAAAGVPALPADLAPGFHTLDLPQGRWRVYAREIRPGEMIAVAQDTASRNKIALGGTLLTLFPLLALIPLLSWLVANIIRRRLQPIRALAGQVDAQTPERPAPLPEARIPEEIAPFIRSINDLLARVRQLMLQQQRFIADAAHELRTPLTALSLQAQNLENADSLTSARERMIPLTRGIARARRLIDQLLHLTRQQSEAGTRAPVSLKAVVQRLLDEALPIAQAKALDLRLVATDNPCVLADPDSLHQLLRNALDNALRYTPQGGEIIVRLDNDGNDALVQIIDSGPGIPSDERERVFQPFYRINGGEGEGSGLGLAIARDVAMRLGGSVTLADRGDRPGLVLSYRQVHVAGTGGASS